MIPWGIYCYDGNGPCPYLDRDENAPKQSNGYCWFLKKGDWNWEEEGNGCGLLWDSCKECGKRDCEGG